MKEYRTIMCHNVPCIYELSWDEKETAIVIRIHEDFISSQGAVPQDAPIVKDFMKTFGFQSFVGDWQEGFGFDGAMQRTGEHDGFMEFLLTVPKIKIITDKDCEHCNGTGQDNNFDNKCGFCSGGGKEYYIDWEKAHSLSASLNVLFLFTSIAEKETSSSISQLMTLQVCTQHGMNGSELGGEFSYHLCQWLGRFGDQYDLKMVTKVAMSAYDKMLGLQGYDQHYFRSFTRQTNGRIIIDVPGNACGIHPTHSGWDGNEGCEFASHNVDSPMQQLSLIAGLAALHDMAREEGVGM